MSEEKSNFHMIPSGILDAQAEAMGVPFIKKTTSAATYEADFKAVLRECKAKGAEGLVTGDIYEVAGHEEGWLRPRLQRSRFNTHQAAVDGRHQTNLP